MIRLLPVKNEPRYAPVRDVMIYLTEDCNLRCTYCFVKKTPKTMTEETARKVADFCFREDVIGIERRIHLNFFGGEPFLALERMAQIVDLAQAPRPNCYVTPEFTATTNGTIATPEVEHVIRKAQMGLLVSLDGTAEANQARPFTSGRPSYAAVRRNLDRLLSWSPRVFLRMTFHPDALDLVQNLESVRELPVKGIYLSPVVEADWSGHEERLQAAYREISDWFIAEFRAGRKPPLPLTWEFLRQEDRLRSGCREIERQRPCEVGSTLMAISWDGQVLPCHRYLDLKQHWLGPVGDALKPKDREQYVHLSADQVERCSDCPPHPCGGGCRVLAMQAGAGFYGHHPNHCLLLKAHAEAVGRIYQALQSDLGFLRQLRLAQPGTGHPIAVQ